MKRSRSEIRRLLWSIWDWVAFGMWSLFAASFWIQFGASDQRTWLLTALASLSYMYATRHGDDD